MPKGKPRGKPFEKGWKGGPGAPPGSNNGGGRRPDWLRRQCQLAADEVQGVQFLQSVIAGVEFVKVFPNGEEVKTQATVEEKRRCLEMLWDRGYGRPVSPVEMKDITDDDELRVMAKRSIEEERGKGGRE